MYVYVCAYSHTYVGCEHRKGNLRGRGLKDGEEENRAQWTTCVLKAESEAVCFHLLEEEASLVLTGHDTHL